MKRRVVIKGIINYIFAMIFAIVFALYLNANVGWFMLFALILAPVLSVFFAWLSARMILVSCDMEESLLSKGDRCTMEVTVRNGSIFPTPPVALKFVKGAGLSCENKEVLVSVISRGTQKFVVDYKAKISGQSIAGIESVRVTDYLGLFSFPVKKIDYEALKTKVAVIPDIAAISPKDDNVVKAMQISLHTDESEDTVEIAANAFGGFPGYDSRNYVPGDPLKRINWKQSAKRNKLLVRLDDEMTSQSISVVLDSVFNRNVDVEELAFLEQYKDCEDEEIIPKVAEDSIENALGIIEVLVKHNYTVNFYAYMDNKFTEYEIEDESDLESVRLELAHYSFSNDYNIERFPNREDTEKKNSVSIFSTPNSYEEAHFVLQQDTGSVYTAIYSVVEEAKKQGNAGSTISLRDFKEKQEEKASLKEKIVGTISPLVIPYLLALSLSVTVFSVFNVKVWSEWTALQALVCAVIFAFCCYVKKHKVIGTMLVTILTVAILSVFSRIVFRDYTSYGQWFMSGGDVGENTTTNLMSVLIVFTVFFAMVVFYFTRTLYRTSFLMLVSLIPFVLYVKVMHNIDIVYVGVVVVLNIAAFLVNTRTIRDKNKRLVGYFSGLLSVGLYAVTFIMIAFAMPKEQETRYYYIFESMFMGGNISVTLPEEYSTMSEFSGNADNFNEINNRRLYVVYTQQDELMYLKRQTFDLYDFRNHRWYPLDEYSEGKYTPEEWGEEKEYMSLALLARAMKRANDHMPGFLKEYNLQMVAGADFTEYRDSIYISTMNFPSASYIVPSRTTEIGSYESDDTLVTEAGVYIVESGLLPRYMQYEVEFFDEFTSRYEWINAGGANSDSETSLKMLEHLKAILDANNETEYSKVAEAFLKEAQRAEEYAKVCEENNEEISERVKELALEITKDCTYDWEKAEALQNYFYEANFMYDLDYDAPDDSVEYFLFEGKTGTCSDFASAFVLMARSVGLTVRYVEGFVPDEEYENQYVVRTNSAHAYPEVYIQNVGFVVYEPTNAARYGRVAATQDNGIASFVMSLGYRILITFALISSVIVTILFIGVLVGPSGREMHFNMKIKKASPKQAIAMIYKRIGDKHSKKYIKDADSLTPYEFGIRFEKVFGYDIGELIYMLENAVYANEQMAEDSKEKAKEIYTNVKAVIKQKKKLERKLKVKER